MFFPNPREFLASNYPQPFHLKSRLLSEDTMHSQRITSESIMEALNKAFEQICCLIDNLALSLCLVVLDFINSVSIRVELLE